jgi:hypothetical protein
MQDMQIIDNIVLLKEDIHSSKMSIEKGMIITLDMENALDYVRHSFLFGVL